MNVVEVKPLISIVVPCYNEEEIIERTERTLSNYLATLVNDNKVSSESYIVFVDDGSVDNTFDILLKSRNLNSKIIKLASNKGHQYALLAGLDYVINKTDCVITIDADLQHDVYAINKMIDAYRSGAHIVYGIWKHRRTETWFKKNSAYFFSLMLRMFGVPLVPRHSDFRLLSNKVLQELSRYKESNLFLRGLLPLINLKTTAIAYEQSGRIGGKTKYTLKKMLSLAINGITSFSNVPIRLITIIGLILFFVTMGLSINVLIIYLRGRTLPGWASISLPMYFLSGVQLLSLGVIGEYIAKIYKETKCRPKYHIEVIVE
ncbi:glycosyltransferase [Chitinophaga caeni]|uniref:Glycosyltransferase n=1 Tax=Chitinophaga caeni TaxID=2029983 RepID=A0A291QRY9_9BACT|nr:glycosyltransferase family 2 protein [Chitinophaga caeni]ATL46707.1 glycosyltransferase [Chitinophaga caeni]